MSRLCRLALAGIAKGLTASWPEVVLSLRSRKLEVQSARVQREGNWPALARSPAVAHPELILRRSPWHSRLWGRGEITVDIARGFGYFAM